MATALDPKKALSVLLAATLVAGLAIACRLAGFGDGPLLGLTAASGAALAVAVLLRWRGVLAAAAGFAVAGLVGGLPVEVAVMDAAAHGLAALAGWRMMLHFARSGRTATRTGEWLGFLGGVVAFSVTVAAVTYSGAVWGLGGVDGAPGRAGLLALVFAPLGLMTCFAIIANLREWRMVLARPGSAFEIAAFGVFLLGVLAVLLRNPIEGVNPSGVTLLVAVPFCLWTAMRGRSLDGATISFVTVGIALGLIASHAGGITTADFVTTVVYLTALIAICQLVHAINLDRVAAMAENEARKLDLESRVVARTAELTAMTERAVAADEAKTRFLATVSHEVRTPLNGIIGMASVLLDGDLDEETRRNVGVVRSSGFHLLSVINRILDFSKLGHSDEPDDVIAFDLRALVEEVVEESRFSVGGDGVVLRIDIEERVGTVHVGWRQGLRQVLTNLVGNALKFTDAGTVTVSVTEPEAGRVRIAVRDTGIGIPADARERIFLPFEQGDGSTTRRYGGTGLGLSICSEMIRKMGGRIGVESALGRGSTFWIEVPLSDDAPQKAEAGRQAVSQDA